MFVAIAAHIVLDDAKTTEQKRLELIAAAEVAETLFAEIVDQVEQQTGLVVVLAVDVAVARQHVQRRFGGPRSEEHTSELQSLMRISYAVFCLKKKKTIHILRSLIILPE